MWTDAVSEPPLAVLRLSARSSHLSLYGAALRVVEVGDLGLELREPHLAPRKRSREIMVGSWSTAMHHANEFRYCQLGDA
jgi:hypothetical protein